MAATHVSFRTDEALKKEFDSVVSSLGMNTSTALNVFMQAVVRSNGFPFPLTLDPLQSETAPERLALNQTLAERQEIIDAGDAKNFATHEDVKEMLGL